MTPSRGRPRGATSRVAEAVEWFRANGPESSLRSCMDALGVGLSTAQRARNQLKAGRELDRAFSPNDPRAGEVAESTAYGPPPVAAAARPSFSDRSADAALLATTMNQALENVLQGTVDVLTPEQTLQFLSEAVRLAPTIQLKTMVIRELNKARALGAEQEKLGPGPPLTEADRTYRASLILQACGTKVAKEAWTAAFSEQITAVEAVKPDVPRETSAEELAERSALAGEALTP